jgi:hypothetical protein
VVVPTYLCVGSNDDIVYAISTQYRPTIIIETTYSIIKASKEQKMVL